MLLKLVVPPAAEPLTVADVKAHLRVVHSAEDVIVERYAKAARLHIEHVLGRSLLTQTWRLWLPRFPTSGIVDLPRPPLVSVTAVRYVAPDGTTATLDPAAYHVITEDITGCIERAASKPWPATDKVPKAVEIEYVAGYGGVGTAVPEDIRNAVLLLAEHLYFNRGVTAEQNLSMNPVAVDHLIGPYRTHGWI